MTFVWLCSYPKSGNTWLRALLTSYLDECPIKQQTDRQLVGPSSHLSCHLFDETMGLNSSDLTPFELDHHRYIFHEHFVQKFRGTTFTKVHDSYRSRYTGRPLFPSHANCRVIYVIRNPLDIVPSYAHHDNTTTNRTIKHMMNPDAMVRHGNTSFDEYLGSWSSHVKEWTIQREIPKIIIRYEDLLENTSLVLTKVLHFCSLPINQKHLLSAINECSFDKLQAREETFGFKERPHHASHFFRIGRAGEGKKTLTDQQIHKISFSHGATMKQFGYS